MFHALEVKPAHELGSGDKIRFMNKWRKIRSNSWHLEDLDYLEVVTQDGFTLLVPYLNPIQVKVPRFRKKKFHP